MKRNSNIALAFLSLFFNILYTKDIEILDFLHRYHSTPPNKNWWQKPTPAPIIFKPDHNKKHKIKEWTYAIKVAGRNDLAIFASRHINQAASIGSNSQVNILFDLHLHPRGQKPVSKRLYVKKGKLIQVGPDRVADSGRPETAIEFFKWCEENYPAKHIAFCFDNHGSGALEPLSFDQLAQFRRTVNPARLFYLNPETKLIELDRSITFFDYLEELQQPELERGLCFDESTNHFLTNQDLAYALNAMCELRKRKIDVLHFDACLMQMSEVLILLKDYADFIVASEEVELGTGGKYDIILEPFIHGSPTPEQLARHIVQAYEKTYNGVTNDYTQSAVTTVYLEELDKNINNLAHLLIKGLSREANHSIKEAIRMSRDKRICPSFHEPSYTDYYCFCENLLKNYNHCHLQTDEETIEFRLALEQELTRACEIVKKAVIANCVGRNLKKAQGISIYFPERRIHPSYYQTRFAASNQWIKFLTTYLTMP